MHMAGSSNVKRLEIFDSGLAIQLASSENILKESFIIIIVKKNFIDICRNNFHP